MPVLCIACCIVHPESPWTKDASRRRDPFASRHVRTFNRLHADERRRTHADAHVYILTCTHATHADARRRTQTHADARGRTRTHADARRRAQTHADKRTSGVGADATARRVRTQDGWFKDFRDVLYITYI